MKPKPACGAPATRPRGDDFHVEGKPLSWSALDRADALARAQRQDFELIIVGGGITGAGIAREAALRHIPFLLVDQGDFAGGTSSASSKLIHGGLRYLAERSFRLVREAATERNWLRQALPNLVRPLPIHLCAYEGGSDSPARIRLGLTVYDLFSDLGSRYRNEARHRILSPAELAEREPALGQSGLLMAGLFHDALVDDARLTLETLKEARDLSGGRSVLLNYVRVERVLFERGRVAGVELRDQESGERFQVECACVVNATGAWSDQLLRSAGQESTLIRPTKGAHLLVPNARVGNLGALALRSPDDGRPCFVLRQGEVSLIGTTDTDYRGDPSAALCEREDCEYLLRAVNAAFPAARLTPADVLSSYAGVRPLIRAEGLSASQVSREHAILDLGTGLLTLAGGKLTTFRPMAWDLLRQASRSGYLRPLRGREASRGYSRRPYRVGLNWAGFERALADLDLGGLLPMASLRHLHQQYGQGALGILREIRACPGAGEPLLAGHPYCTAEIQHILAFENAPHLVDVMARRTSMQLTLGHRQQADLAPRVAAILARRYQWDEARTRQELRVYLDRVRASMRFQG